MAHILYIDVYSNQNLRNYRMKIQNLVLVIALTLLLSSCSDPYFSMSGESKLMIERDIRFLEIYETTLCNIKEMHEREEISRGKCLALYYEFKENDGIQDGRKVVAKRVGYIMSNPDSFDRKYSEQLSEFTTKIGDCNSYINKNCM